MHARCYWKTSIRERERVAVKIKSMTRNTSDALPFVRERLGAGQRLTAPDKLGWNRKTRTNRKPTELQPEVKENPERYQLREKKRESLHSNSRIFLPVGVSLPPVLPPGPEWQSVGQSGGEHKNHSPHTTT